MRTNISKLLSKFKLPLVDRYLLWEFLKPFLFSIFAITVITISSTLFEMMDMIIVKQVAAIKVLKLLLYKLPDVMVKSFGVGVLFSTILSLTQLVKNNEFTAMRMGGIGLHRIMLPFLILAIIISGSTYFINEHVVPWTNHRSENIVRRIILQDGIPTLQAGVFFKGVEDRYIYINEINRDTGEMKDIIVYELQEEKTYPRMITAKRGYFKNKVWHLQQGKVQKFNEEGKVIYQSGFQDFEINVNKKLDNFYGEQKTTAEMSRQELQEDIETFKKSGLEVDSLMVDYHRKLATPFASLIFVLVGAPLSIKSDKGKVFGIVASIITILFYYIFMSFCRSLGGNGLLNPILAAWLPNIVFAVVGGALLIKEEFLNFF
ncbi:MAG: LptF/LptG family permease [Halanaerobacter sp.]